MKLNSSVWSPVSQTQVSHFLNLTPPPERIESAENDEEMLFVTMLLHNVTWEDFNKI